MRITRKFKERKEKRRRRRARKKIGKKNGRRRHRVICGKQIIVRAANHSARWPTSVRGLARDENPAIYWPIFFRLVFERHPSSAAQPEFFVLLGFSPAEFKFRLENVRSFK